MTKRINPEGIIGWQSVHSVKALLVIEKTGDYIIFVFKCFFKFFLEFINKIIQVFRSFKWNFKLHHSIVLYHFFDFDLRNIRSKLFFNHCIERFDHLDISCSDFFIRNTDHIEYGCWNKMPYVGILFTHFSINEHIKRIETGQTRIDLQQWTDGIFISDRHKTQNIQFGVAIFFLIPIVNPFMWIGQYKSDTFDLFLYDIVVFFFNIAFDCYHKCQVLIFCFGCRQCRTHKQ